MLCLRATLFNDWYQIYPEIRIQFYIEVHLVCVNVKLSSFVELESLFNRDDVFPDWWMVEYTGTTEVKHIHFIP